MEEQEKQMLRKECKFKAQPIRKYKPVITPSQMEITTPNTPQFLTRKTVTTFNN